MGVNSLPKTVTRQRRDCDLNPGPSAPESSTLTMATEPLWFLCWTSNPLVSVAVRPAEVFATGGGISFRHRRLDTSLLSYNDRSIVRDVYTYRVLGICPVPEHVPRKSPP